MSLILPGTPGFSAPARRKPLYLPPSYHEHKRAMTARRIERQVLLAIGEKYPGHAFDIEVIPHANGQPGGVIGISHPFCMDEKGKLIRFIVHNVDDDDKILEFCGQILERLKLPRGEVQEGWRETAVKQVKAGAFNAKDS